MDLRVRISKDYLHRQALLSRRDNLSPPFFRSRPESIALAAAFLRARRWFFVTVLGGFAGTDIARAWLRLFFRAGPNAVGQ